MPNLLHNVLFRIIIEQGDFDFLDVGLPTTAHLVFLETYPIGLSPSFNSTHYEYSADVPQSINVVSVVFALSNNATAHVLGLEKGKTGVLFQFDMGGVSRQLGELTNITVQRTLFYLGWVWGCCE